MNRIRHDIRTYSFDAARKYFLDTNVLLAVYGPFPPGDRRSRTYSGSLKKLRSDSVPVFLDALVMSEFVNRWARYEFNRRGGEEVLGQFKVYRGSSGFNPVAEEITQALGNILKFVRPAPTAFANIDLQALLQHFQEVKADFNDLLIAETCSTRSYILITDDADLTFCDTEIVSANAALLAG